MFRTQKRCGVCTIVATVQMPVAATSVTPSSCHHGLHGNSVPVTTAMPTRRMTELVGSSARIPTAPTETAVTANAAKARA